MKRFLTAIMTGALLVVFSGCGGGSDANGAKKPAGEEKKKSMQGLQGAVKQ